jgi:hypothetical protein
MMSATTSAGPDGCPFLFQGGAGLAKPVQNGATAVHLKAVMSRDVGQKLLADGTFQMNEIAAGNTLEMEVMATIPPTYVLVDVSGLTVAAVFPRQTLITQLGEVAVYRTLAAGLTVLPIHLTADFLRRKLAVGPTLQKIQQALSPRRFIHSCHGIPPLGTDYFSIQV